MAEWAQARGLAAPRYEEAARSGPPHAPLFVMRVVLQGYEPVTGEATSKRAAHRFGFERTKKASPSLSIP